jgi:hypothetical protein
MRRVLKIRSSCYAIIEKFNEHIRIVRTLRDQTTGSLVLRLWEVEKYVIGIVNMLFKTVSNILIVGSNKLEFVKSYDSFKRKMEKLHNMTKSLIDTFSIEILRNKENGVEYRCSYQKRFIEDAEIILKESKSDSSDSIDLKYKVLLEDLESLDLLVNNSTEKNEANDKINVDCNVETIDKFVEKYSLRLLEYCNILINYDEVFLSENYLGRNEKNKSPDFTALENTYDDILIARELMKYLLNYQNDDKTDFLIFSQTDYFMNKLSEKIKGNLKKFYNILCNKDTTLKKMTRNKDHKISDNDYDCYKRIDKLQKDLKSVFNSKDSSTAQTFQTIITNLKYNPVQNDITPSRNGFDGENQNTINEQSELNNDENQSTNNDQTNKETKLEENSYSLENNISKDETKEARTEISNTTNLNTDSNDKRGASKKNRTPYFLRAIFRSKKHPTPILNKGVLFFLLKVKKTLKWCRPLLKYTKMIFSTRYLEENKK